MARERWSSTSRHSGRLRSSGNRTGQLAIFAWDPAKRALLRVNLLGDEKAMTAKVVEQLMGNKPEERFKFISNRAEFVSEEGLDI